MLNKIKSLKNVIGISKEIINLIIKSIIKQHKLTSA